jgi:phosphate-selective porin OprO/OprP
MDVLLYRCMVCVVVGLMSSVANLSYSETVEQEIQDIEQQIKKTNAELLDAQLNQQKNLIELNQAKLALKQKENQTHPHSNALLKDLGVDEMFPPQNRVKNSLLALDYDRYPPNIYPNYFKFSSPDNQFELEFHGWSQVDNDIFTNYLGLYVDDGPSIVGIVNQSTVDRLMLRRLRPTLEGQLTNYLQYFFNIDFGQGSISLYDAFVDVNYYRAMGLQVGLQMSLVSGIENFFDNFDYLSRAFTMEMGYPAMMAPDRQIGAMLHGSFGPSGQEPYWRGLSQLGFDDWFSYQVGIFNGVPDSSQVTNYTTIGNTYPYPYLKSSQTVFTQSNKAFAGRVFFNPFIAAKGSILEHLGIGFAGSAERPNYQYGLPDLVSLGQNPIFTYTALPYRNSFYTVAANGPRTRLHPQLTWGYGPLGILADWAQTQQHLQLISFGALNTIAAYYPRTTSQTNQAGQIQFIYNLTQEDFNLFHFIPNNKFKPFEKGAYGGFQLVFRLSKLLLDPSVFKDYVKIGANQYYLYSDPRISVQQANSWSIGLNWYWNEFLRLTTEYDYSSYVGGCSTGGVNAPVNPGCQTAGQFIFASSSTVLNRPAEKIIMQRLQLTF